MTFLKKYLPYITIAILIGLLSVQQNCINNRIADYLGEKAKTEEMAKNIAAKDRLLNGYRKINDRLYAEKAVLVQKIKDSLGDVVDFTDLSEKQRREILKLRDFKQQAERLNLELIASNDFIIKLGQKHALDIDNINAKWQAIVDNLNGEINALNQSWDDLNKSNGELVKSLVKCRLGSSQRLILGPFIGIGVDGKPTAGLGVTLHIVRLPFKLF